MASLSSFVFFIILGVTSLNPIGCYGQSKEEKEHKLLFVIGDSLFDPGNNPYLNASQRLPQSYYPYGINFYNHSTGRISDGRLVPDFIALFAKLHMVPPFLEPGANLTDGVSFASAGSGCLEDHPDAMNLKIQLTNFKKVVTKTLIPKLGEQKAKELLMRSVFLISMGGNDYFSFNTNFPNATQSERKKYQRLVISKLKNALREIYKLGGRKFAFQDVGPLGCVPMIKQLYPELNGSCNKNFLSHAKMHNKALSNALKKLESRLKDFKYSLFDYYNSLLNRINNAPKYGFKQGKIGCCGNGQFNGENCGGGDDGTEAYNLCKDPSEYVFFDGGHTTEKTNHQFAELLWSGVPNITGPYNVKQLFELP